MHNSTTPISSRVTSMLLMRDITPTPTVLMTVVRTSSRLPGITALCVGLATMVNPLHSGRQHDLQRDRRRGDRHHLCHEHQPTRGPAP
jgi:hypothetical protein